MAFRLAKRENPALVIRARVERWSDEQGWGVLEADEAPGGVFVHFSAIQEGGYRFLRAGQTVELEPDDLVPYGHEGCAYRAVRVRPVS